MSGWDWVVTTKRDTRVRHRDRRVKVNKRERSGRARNEAALSGAMTFNTGLPCRRGHVADRYTNNGACVECERLRYLPKESK